MPLPHTIWYQVQRIDKWVYVIRERLDRIEPRFLTEYANNYLIVGAKQAALIDTGIGLYSIKRIVQPLIRDREIFVFNTHHHFDHIGNNHEWLGVHIHKFDLPRVVLPEELSFLKTATSRHSMELLKKGSPTRPAIEHYPLVGEETFELGGIDLRIIHTPGHTPGSVCVLTSKDHLISGDTIHNGTIYLPPKDSWESYSHSLTNLMAEFGQEQNGVILGGHEEPIVAPKNVELLNQIIQNWQEISCGKKQKYDDFLDAHVLSYPPFKFVIPTK